MLIASLVIHLVKEVGTVTQKEINSECRTLAYRNNSENITFSYGYSLTLQKIKTLERT